MTTGALRFHWSLSSVGDQKRHVQDQQVMSGVADLDAHTRFAVAAEECGIESLLMAFGFTRPDPVAWSVALGTRTQRIEFLVAMRSGISAPTYFVQQINTLSALTNGRVRINIVAGRNPTEQRYYGDFLDHDERYERTDEFWRICHALWRNDGPVTFDGRHYQVTEARLRGPFVSPTRTRPEIYMGGASEQAAALAVAHADCLLTVPDRPDRLAERIRPVLDSGTEVGLLVTLVPGDTREEAMAAARSLIDTAGDSAARVHQGVRRATDSVGFGDAYRTAEEEDPWLTRYLWTGAVPYMGPPSIALVGAPDDLVDALFEYREIGVTQFLFVGHPDLATMRFFGTEILPKVRDRESRAVAAG